MTEDSVAAGPAVDANTDVVLSDGATVNVNVRVIFKTTAQPEIVVRMAITSWFRGSGEAQQLTVSKFVNDINHTSKLVSSLKQLNDATNAILVGFTLKSPPIPGFEDKSKQVTAILKSGETVRLTFAAPPGAPAAPDGFAIDKAYNFLIGLSLSDLGTGFQKSLNAKLLPPNHGWGYLIHALEVVNCPCTLR